MFAIVVTDKIPPNYVIPSAGTHLYKYGINYYKFNDEKRLSLIVP